MKCDYATYADSYEKWLSRSTSQLERISDHAEKEAAFERVEEAQRL